MSESTLPQESTERQSEESLWEIEDAAGYLNVSNTTIRRLVRAGELPHKRVGGQIRFVPDVVRGWARTQAAS